MNLKIPHHFSSFQMHNVKRVSCPQSSSIFRFVPYNFWRTINHRKHMFRVVDIVKFLFQNKTLEASGCSDIWERILVQACENGKTILCLITREYLCVKAALVRHVRASLLSLLVTVVLVSRWSSDTGRISMSNVGAISRMLEVNSSSVPWQGKAPLLYRILCAHSKRRCFFDILNHRHLGFWRNSQFSIIIIKRPLRKGFFASFHEGRFILTMN